ncbi:hypothetical protein [Sagittula salina]|uniref:Uncharacterized protein n=1 Tax=Sagittula salina TaxID=2820268 RepID=A0A940S5J5_9RHOB|nr:hypothetical protein [Sagittula salina]MBP0485194.1 hypothetical protein [Sagittula salina]
MLREIVELHRLLSLDRVGDPDSVEAGCFARIDPISPAVEKICVLADELRSHLEAYAEADGVDPFWSVSHDAA